MSNHPSIAPFKQNVVRFMGRFLSKFPENFEVYQWPPHNGSPWVRLRSEELPTPNVTEAGEPTSKKKKKSGQAASAR